MQIGERLRVYRHEHGLTQIDMAMLVGCSNASICVWENGGAMLGVSVLALETVLSIDTPRAVLEKVRQGAGTAVEQELARVMAENAALRKANDVLRNNLFASQERMEGVKQWMRQRPI